ncbi:aminotransferase class I/II-fold pyridoxal phosphate-dependent enzyme [Sphaerisporangium sp. NPDC049003]|uniref:aminotransferase class I/II-fold pyridoxal phosphate-dependent enzyme n=1 Tax=Sphaerisporangium sp. NPDC049003 TaxID=3364517 RepID=UPI00371E1DAE
MYRELREGVPSDSAQLGFGYNLYPAAPVVHRFLCRALKACADDDRLHQYGTAADGHDRALAAALAGAYLGCALDADQIVFTSGATEGIALVIRFLAGRDTGLWLPAPCYYAFEQTPHRCGGTVLGRYRHDGVMDATGASARHTALVEIFPNGVTGTLYVPPPVQVDFRVIDVVFLAGGSGPAPHMVTEHVRAALSAGIQDAAVLMTPSKDLCVPGIRSGLLISGHEPLISAVRGEVFDRTASSNPLAGQLVLLYLATLLLAEAADSGRPAAFCDRYRWLRAQYARYRVPALPSETAFRAIVDHLDAMSSHFTTAFDLLGRHTEGLLETGRQLRPMAGYSLLPRLTAGPEHPDDIVGWVNAVGRQFALKLNPTVLFGGTSGSWQALYPGQIRIRVNLSVPHRDLLNTLDLLRTARENVVSPRREAA